MKSNDKRYLEVGVPIDILKKYCIWSIVKFITDGHHIQQNSSRNDLMGGFLDRWINRIPESLIFNELLADEEFDVVNDDFFYTNEVAKNAPDVIGLVKKDKMGKKNYYPFYTFNINSWTKYDDDAPFIEMKTTRNTQKLATIAIRQDDNQIDDNYYVLVESNINDNYLLHLLDKNMLNNNFFNKKYIFNSSNDFIKGSMNIIGNPNDVINSELTKLAEENVISTDEKEVENVGEYRLCGIYKGSIIKKYASKVGNDDDEKPISPRYLKSIDELYDENFISTSFEHDYYTDSNQSIPFLIDIYENSNLFIESIDGNQIIFSVNGKADIFDLNCNKLESLENAIYKLNFDKFISNLYKYYYLKNLIKIDENTLNLNNSDFERTELGSGIFSFDGNDFKNLKFDIDYILNSKCEIYNITKSTIDCNFDDEVTNSIYFKKGLCKLKFKNNGDFESVDFTSCKKNEILYDYNSNNDFHLNLRFELYHGAKLRFIKKNKGNCILCIDGFGLIYDYNTQTNHLIYDSFYNIEIYDGTNNRRNNIFFKIKDLNETNRIDNPEIEFNKTIPLNNQNFYIPDSNENNIKIKFDFISKDPKIMIVKEKFKDESKEVLSYLYLTIDGEASINGKTIDDNANNIYRKIWKLNFEDFERTSKNEEYVLSKEAIISSNESCENELIDYFKRYIEKLDNN